VAEIHHFAYGWINPTLAYVMSFLGSLSGLVLAARARESDGFGRARWLMLAAVSIGGTAIWLMHFMAMIGFDVPATVVRYDVPMTTASFVVAVVIVGLGLFSVGFGALSVPRIVVSGVFTGAGVAAMHYTGMAALRLSGRVSYDPRLVALSVLIAVVGCVVALWFAVVVNSAGATVGAAMLIAVAVCSMHYTAMGAVRVRLTETPVPQDAVRPFVLLAPISVFACFMITAMAYATVGFSVRQENRREEEFLAQARDEHQTAAMPSARLARHRPASSGPNRAESLVR
jgi:NO-binding membrane sensor protein with MHYT domain